MALFLAIDNTIVLSNKIEFKNNNKDLIAFKNLDKLREYILKNHKTYKGWYYIEVDMKKDNLDEDEDSRFYKDRIIIDKPTVIKMNNKNPLPLMDDGKEWRRIPNFSKYLASDVGDILTLKTGNYTKGVSAGHYLKVSLFKDGSSKSKMEYVHILICSTFKGPGKRGQVVMHMDDDKFNCRADNLQWGSQSENIQMVWDRRKEKYNMENYNIMKDFKDTIASFEEVKQYTDTISTEDGFISNINEYVLSRVNHMSELFSINFDKLTNTLNISKDLDTTEIRSNALKVTSELKDVKFKDVDERMSPVTLGMNVSLIEFNDILNKHLKEFDKTVRVSLKDLNIILSSIISDESYRKSFKPKALDIRKTSELKYKIREDLEKLIDPSSKTDRLKVSKLVPNIASIGPLAKDTAMLANHLKKNDLDYIAEMTDEISEKVSILYGYIKEKESDFVISKATLGSLAEALDVNASLVTLYSAYYSLINQQVGMVNSLIDIIKK